MAKKLILEVDSENMDLSHVGESLDEWIRSSEAWMGAKYTIGIYSNDVMGWFTYVKGWNGSGGAGYSLPGSRSGS